MSQSRVDVGPTHQQLFSQLKRHMDDFVRNCDDLILVIRQIFRFMVHEHLLHYRGMSWSTHWKPISKHGYDVIKNRTVDYGNIEYAMLLSLFVARDPWCNCCIRTMATDFSSLDPGAQLTEHAIEMQGDVVEIWLAALRGHEFFSPILPELVALSGRQIPDLFNRCCELCRTIHLLDGFLATGWLKYKMERVPTIIHRLPQLLQDESVAIWHVAPIFACPPPIWNNS